MLFAEQQIALVIIVRNNLVRCLMTLTVLILAYEENPADTKLHTLNKGFM